MDSWDDDDYDPTANAALADKIVTLGLDERLRAEKEESAEPADEKKTSNDKKSKKTAGRAGSEDVDLTEADRRRLQERSDRKLAADLFGIEDDSEPTFDDLETKAEFTEFAQRIGEMFAKRAKNEHYLHFVRELVKVTCAPMTKFQLETVQGVVKEYIDVHVKKENEAKKAEVPKVQKKAQKAKKKELYEDFGEDEYADYADLEDKF
ncbi:hypothetical protein AAVH_37771 [Aphelenchoides avenae]|nr:hypothetical protein AAVH_37771 [Aphelenchus avenae]